MIPAIGLIIASYTLVRLVSFMTRPGEKMLVRVLSGLAILITVVSVLDLLRAGSQVTSSMPNF